jgi:hypothetical protein
MPGKLFKEHDNVRGGEAEPIEEHDGVRVRPISDLGLTRMVRQREEVTRHVAGAARELEELKRRQAQIEKEKSSLEELSRRQDDYERAKREIVEGLQRSLVRLEKDGNQAARAVELISGLSGSFQELLAELQRIDESGWTEETFPAELGKAMSRVQDARAQYEKGHARLEASAWHRAEGGGSVAALAAPDAAAYTTRGFGYWFRVGLAVSLPLILALAVLFVLWVVLRRAV